MKTRERVYQAIVDHMDRYGESPTVREIQAATGLRSTSQVADQLKQLEREGRIVRTPLKSRGVEVPGSVATPTARAGAMIAERLIASSEMSRESIGDVLVPAEQIELLRRWAERVSA